MMSTPAVLPRNATADWEHDLTQLLDDLLQTQQAMLELLERKRSAMVRRDLSQIRELQPQEEQLCERLQACQDRRNELLAAARQAQLPDGNLEQLSRGVPLQQADEVQSKLSNASSRAMLLKHQSFTNWIIAQRNLLHISQLLENITTGGRPLPTYGIARVGTSSGRGSGGGFVLDQQA
jgi:flagellar biosynthesis/type III secretory pathway chaperone